MNSLRVLSTLLLLAAISFAVAPASKKKPAPKTASTKSTSKKKSKKKAASWRNTQRTPTPDRYKEIQQALTSKGYDASPTGVWDAPSIEALKRFQEDQSLEPSGKIDSISLIALGLGPRRDPPPIPQP